MRRSSSARKMNISGSVLIWRPPFRRTDCWPLQSDDTARSVNVFNAARARRRRAMHFLGKHIERCAEPRRRQPVTGEMVANVTVDQGGSGHPVLFTLCGLFLFLNILAK